MKSTHNITIQGKKGGSQSSSYTPVEQSDDLLSDAKLKMLVAVCEGETEGTVTAQQIYLNDTPLANEDGTYNFTGVSWEFRNGTQDQEYIQGMPEIDNELSVGVAVTTSSPWTHQFTDTSLDAIRIKLSLPAQYQYKDNGDMVGTITEYAIDLSTDGGSYETVVSGKFDGKTTSEYQRDHRINLTKGATSWAVRVRRITADSTSTKLVNAFKVYSYAEVIDSKLRYPNTALLYVEVDAEQFTSGAPKVTVKMKGKLIRVPDNYDPDTREYTGTWDGSFKMAYSNNPAWVFYDIILDKVSGMGNRIDSSMIDKWELYQIAEYCDEMVSDGASGKEPRFTCNAYIQSQEDAFTVLQDFAAIFRGITFWGNSQIVVSADAPVNDLEWTYTAANVVDGSFSYAGGSYKNRYTSCLVSYSDPQNHYSDTTEAVYDSDLLSRYGVQQTSLTAIGCTSQSEAHRRGRWMLLSNVKDGTVSFSVGLDGHIPLPASIIGVADPYRAGKNNGGRISTVSGLSVTLDRAITFGAGDRLIVNLPDGTAQTRTIAGVSDDKKTVTVSTAFKTTPVAGAVWIIDSDNLAIQQFRVTSITDNDDGTFTVAAVQYDPNKYSYIDDGVMVESAPVTVTPATVMSAPGNITVNEVSHTSQGISLSSLQVAWDAVKGAVKYSAQWRRDSGEWINAGSVSSQGFTVNNIYAGIYEVRVRSVNSSGVSSPWGTSDTVTLTGKQGKPPVPLSLTASDNTVFGIDLSWTFGDGSDDGLKTTLMVSTLSDHSDEALLADIPYPQSTYSLTGLASGVVRYFRASFTDKSGNQSDRTDYVQGQSSSSASDVLSYLAGEIGKTELAQDLTTEIGSKADQTDVDSAIKDAKDEAASALTSAQTALENADINETAARKAADSAESTARSQAIASEASTRASAITAEANARADAILNEQNAREADISTVKTLIQNGDDSLAQQIAQVAAGTGDQFDSLDIWYFDDNSVDGWSGNGGTPAVSADGWMTPPASGDTTAISPAVSFPSSSYRFVKLRVKKVGSPVWNGQLRWTGASGTFNDTNMVTISEPDWDASGIATITFEDVAWTGTGTITRIRFDLIAASTSSSYVAFDWIAIGRPTPGAGMAALQFEQTARVNADAAEAANRTTLAAQLRGPYTGTDASQVTSGLLYSEQQLRISGDKAEATARQALETKLDNSVSGIDTSLDTLNTKASANASDITSLKSSLATTNSNVANKADSSALQTLSQAVTSQGNTISSQGTALTNLTSTVTSQAKTLANKADTSALNNYYTKTQADAAAAGQISQFSANMAIGGRNLILGSADLSGGTHDGTYEGNAVITASKASTNSLNYVDLWDVNTIEPAMGSTYVYSFYAKAKSNGDTCVVYFYSPNTTTSATTSQGSVSSGSDGAATFTLTTEMRRYWVIWTQDSTTSQKSLVACRITKDTTKDQQVWLSSPQLEEGNVPTAWSYAPEDIQAGTDANATAISNLSTTVSNQGNAVTSQGQNITNIQATLKSMDGEIFKKADASALRNLSSTVSNQGSAISSQGDAITTLDNSITGILQQGSAINVNPMFATADNWHMALGAVWGPNAGDGKAGVIMTKNSSSNPELYPNNGNWTMVTGARRYRFVVRGKSLGGAGNIIVRRHYKNGQGGNDSSDDITLTFPTDGFATKTADFAATPADTVMVFFQSYCYPSIATVAIDSMSVYDITDALSSGANATAISNLSSTVSSQGSTISSQGTSITNLQNSLASTNKTVTTKADSSSLSTLQSKVTSQGNTLTSQGNSITSLQNTVSDQAKTIATKADSSALNNYYTKTQADSATAGQISNFSASMVVGGRNLIAGTADLSGATIDGNFNGNNVATNTLPKSSSLNYVDLWDAVTANPVLGNTYVYSFYARAKSNGDTCVVYFYSPNTTTGAVSSQGATGTGSDGAMTFKLTTTMQRYWVVWTQGSNPAVKNVVTCRITADSSKDQQVWMSCPQLEEGNVPTAWSPAPEDVQSGTDANTTAINSLKTTVTNQGNSLSTQGESITELSSSLSDQQGRGINLVTDGGFESYSTTSGPLISDGAHHSGSKAAKFRRLNATGSGGNQDVSYGGFFNTGGGRTLYIELWARYDANTTSTAGGPVFGIWTKTAAGGNSWTNAGNVPISSLPTSNAWVKFSGYATLPADTVSASFWMSLQQTSANAQGTSLLIDDIFVTDVTDGYNAQASADANTSAINTLKTTVTSQGNTLTAQGSSISSLTSRVGSVESSIQTTQKTVSSLDGTVSAMYSVKVQTSGNKTSIAGFGLSSDATTGSEFLVQADRFALISSNGGNVSSPFAVQGDVAYLNSAFIQNASITTEMIGEYLCSNNYNWADGSTGWLINKEGYASFTDIVINGGTIKLKDSNGVVRVEMSSS